MHKHLILPHIRQPQTYSVRCAVAGEEKRKKILMRKTAGRIRSTCLAHAMSSWQAIVGMEHEKKKSTAKAVALWQNRMLAKTWKSMVAHSHWKKETRQICNRWKNPFQVRNELLLSLEDFCFLGLIKHRTGLFAWLQENYSSHPNLQSD